MRPWMKRVRAALVMGLMWAVVWAPVAVVVGLVIDPDGSMDEMWVAVGAYAGFIGGVVFSMILAAATRRRTLGELSIARVAGWGAAAGLLVGSLPFLLGTPAAGVPLWALGGAIVGSITVLSAASAAGSLALARRGDTRKLPPPRE